MSEEAKKVVAQGTLGQVAEEAEQWAQEVVREVAEELLRDKLLAERTGSKRYAGRLRRQCWRAARTFGPRSG